MSLVVPTFNSVRFLPQLIAALELLDPSPSEVIFIDDGSSDGTVEVLNQLIGASTVGFKPQIIRHESNQGSAAARNAGLEIASGEIVAFCDADDLPLPGRIAAHRADLVGYSSGAVSYGAIAGFRDSVIEAFYVRGGWRYRVGDVSVDLLRRNFVPFSTVAVCGKARSVRFQGNRYNEDWLYLLDLSQNFRFFTQRVPLATYRYSATQKTSVQSSRQKLLASVIDDLQVFASRESTGVDTFRRVARSTARALKIGGAGASIAFSYRELLDFVPSRLRSSHEIDRFLLGVSGRAGVLSQQIS